MEKPSWIGQTLGGRYRIDDMLGQGGMSAVYKATDPNLKRVVAVKLIHSHLSTDPTFVQRFESEAAAVASLRHSNIVQVYDFNSDDGVYYMVLEFIPGETLQDRLKRLSENKRTLSVEDALRFTANIADAVGYAHQRGMVHRDIKPANIMLDVQGQAILMDFGIVKILGGDSHTSTGAVVGTALYMSPELIRGEVADHRADIYSLGVTLYEMLSGRPPFIANSAMTLMMMHLNDPVPDLRSFRPDVPAEVIEIVKKCLAKDRDKRYQSAAELSRDLRRALTNMEIQSTTVAAGEEPSKPDQATMVSDRPVLSKPEMVSVSQSQPQPKPRPSNSSPNRKTAPILAALGVGVIAIAACAVFGFNYFRNSLAQNNAVPEVTATTELSTAPSSSTSTSEPLLPITGNTQEASSTDLPAIEPTTQSLVSFQHVSFPATDVTTGTDVFDVYSRDTASEKRAPYGDSYDLNLLERPFLQDMTYVPDLDIKTFSIKADNDWYYVSINLIGTDPNNSIGINYGVDLDTDKDGFGDFLIYAKPPYTKDWQTDIVQVFADKNHDTAGKLADKSDAPLSTPTDGYETVIFDGAKGVGEDSDLAWVRLAADNSIQFAFKKSWAGSSFMFGVMSDAGLKDPSKMDYTDRFTAAEAGSSVREKSNYPLQELYAVDNTCRSAFGFSPTGYEKRICSKIIQPVAGGGGGGGGGGPQGCQPPPGGCSADAPNWWPDPHCACSATPYNGQ